MDNTILNAILPEDYKMLKSLLTSEIARNLRNPTTYYSNLFQRALDIVTEHVSEDAIPVEFEKRFSMY